MLSGQENSIRQRWAPTAIYELDNKNDSDQIYMHLFTIILRKSYFREVWEL